MAQAKSEGVLAEAKPHAHYLVLDGLRGVAAFIVLVFHITQQQSLSALPYAGLAVDFFYVLSDFVVIYAYEPRLTGGSMSVRAFMLARAKGLYPLILLSTMIGGGLDVLAFLAHRISAIELFAALTLGLLLLPEFAFPRWASASFLFVIALFPAIVGWRRRLSWPQALADIRAGRKAFVPCLHHAGANSPSWGGGVEASPPRRRELVVFQSGEAIAVVALAWLSLRFFDEPLQLRLRGKPRPLLTSRLFSAGDLRQPALSESPETTPASAEGSP